MNSTMRGITAKKARRKHKLATLEAVINQQDTMIKFLNSRLEQEIKKNATINIAEREELPALFADTKDDSKAVEESRRTVLEGQSEIREVSKGTGEIPQIIMADQTIIEAEGD